MKAENLQPATLEECSNVLEALPDLTAPGFDGYYAAYRERKNARRALEGLPAEARGQPTPITDLGVRGQISSERVFLRQGLWAFLRAEAVFSAIRLLKTKRDSVTH